MKLGVFALSLLLVSSIQAGQDDAKKAAEMLQGNWAITSFNGTDVPSEAEAYLVFSGTNYEQWVTNAVNERGSIKLDASAKPMTIDLVITEGDDAGKTQLGVFEVAADTLTMTLGMPGETVRPKALAQGALHVVLKKAK